MYALAILVHLAAVVWWVGGMAFAWLVLRPAAAGLEPSARLTLWHDVLARFLSWVWLAVAALLASGYWMLFAVLGGFAGAGMHVHLMQGIGIVMMLLFAHVWFAPWRRLRVAVEAADWQGAATQLAAVRRIVGINLLLGLAVIAIAAGGRYAG